MALDAVSAMKEILAAVKHLYEVREMAVKLQEKLADMMARLLAFEPHLASIQHDLQRGRFRDPGQLHALLRLHTAVLAAEWLISTHPGTKRGGVIAWAKGAFHAQGDTDEFKDVEAAIDRAVQDLTLSEVWRGFAQQVHTTAPPDISPFLSPPIMGGRYLSLPFPTLQKWRFPLPDAAFWFWRLAFMAPSLPPCIPY